MCKIQTYCPLIEFSSLFNRKTLHSLRNSRIKWLMPQLVICSLHSQGWWPKFSLFHSWIALSRSACAVWRLQISKQNVKATISKTSQKMVLEAVRCPNQDLWKSRFAWWWHVGGRLCFGGAQTNLDVLCGDVERDVVWLVVRWCEMRLCC